MSKLGLGVVFYLALPLAVRLQLDLEGEKGVFQ